MMVMQIEGGPPQLGILCHVTAARWWRRWLLVVVLAVIIAVGIDQSVQLPFLINKLLLLVRSQEAILIAN